MDICTYIKGGCIGLLAFVSMILGVVKEWLILLFIGIAADYITGIIAAAVNGKLSSANGWNGILKKLSYFGAAGVTIIIDWALLYAGEKIGIKIEMGGLITMILIAWMLLNELISILENLGEIGVPLPGNLKKMLLIMQQKVNNQIKTEDEVKECEEKEEE